MRTAHNENKFGKFYESYNNFKMIVQNKRPSFCMTNIYILCTRKLQVGKLYNIFNVKYAFNYVNKALHCKVVTSHSIKTYKVLLLFLSTK